MPENPGIYFFFFPSDLLFEHPLQHAPPKAYSRLGADLGATETAYAFALIETGLALAGQSICDGACRAYVHALVAEDTSAFIGFRTSDEQISDYLRRNQLPEEICAVRTICRNKTCNLHIFDHLAYHFDLMRP
jgi:hypothetical protein